MTIYLQSDFLDMLCTFVSTFKIFVILRRELADLPAICYK